MHTRFLLSYLLFLTALIPTQAQGFKTVVPPGNIKTIILNNPKDSSEVPIIRKGESLMLSFDDLQGTAKNYRYTLIRYTHDWKASRLFQSEYIDGVHSAYIQRREKSRQTNIPYQHYQLRFPNSTMQIRLSGNYSIRVFLGDRDKPIIARRFCIYEDGSSIALSAARGVSGNTMTEQQLSAKAIVKPYLDLSRNSQNVYAYALQNTNWNTLKGPISARFITQNSLDYSFSKALRFPGGDEFHWFDTKSLISGGISISRLVKKDFITHTYLKPNNPWNGKQYDFFQDLDGGFAIRNIEGLDEHNSALNADYTWVHFSLNTFNPLMGQEVYVVGDFNNWQASEENKMHFNAKKRRYEAAILLKQGFYNYGFMTREQGSGKLDYTAIDGSHWQTENHYHFLLYMRLWNERFDRLIGTASTTTGTSPRPRGR